MLLLCPRFHASASAATERFLILFQEGFLTLKRRASPPRRTTLASIHGRSLSALLHRLFLFSATNFTRAILPPVCAFEFTSSPHGPAGGGQSLAHFARTFQCRHTLCGSQRPGRPRRKSR